MSNVTSVHMDPADIFTLSFDTNPWASAEGVAAVSYAVTPSGGVVIQADSMAAGVVTVECSAPTAGSVAFRVTFSDGQVRERSIYVRVSDQ